ncbi:PAAR domain-containing protein [Spirosoma sp.]|uniref:PAAR domain-containing protein n=1 Tax=Spirosoma sp. TaxID=1899569 RepID=UPI00261AE1A6|nr:PAAR domain-containing protein [Spirosoma sp.]MCX6218596.1 PAAR domain-containing protein [Spirosoma sp.]
MLPAARVSDLIVSSATVGVPTPIIPPGTPNVFIGKLPAARMGDTCGVDAIIKGSATVFIGGLPAARISDLTAAGGAIMPPGCPTVLIGG